ncbi:hypothetical protein [Clostridium scatologenes]|uniref:NADPH-dependent FMN reductase n=1 Tax=Clostridium scatologenes TaxID=1548 RepID=A0A0E3MA94_CLOSL|nr:hypothetical protein [Clostridium scatologenes]AKA70444.1 NADPH-dependent FMN reductase [Clostridium scatologenes]
MYKAIAEADAIVFGWKLEDYIHYCGNNDEVFNELSSRAFKDGKNLVE